MARPLDGCDWLERALARPGPATPERLEALIGRAFLLPRSGRVPAQRGEELLRDALALAVDAGLDMAAARTRYFLGELSLSRGNHEQAEPLLQTALQAFETMDAPFSAAWCHHALAWCAMATGDRRSAREHFERILELTHRLGPAEFLQLHAAAGLAPLAALDGEEDRAESLAAQAVAVARRLPAGGLRVMALTRASETALLSGRHPQATLAELIRLLLDLAARAWVLEVLEMAALVCEADGRPRAAARLLAACRAIGETVGDRPESRILWSAVDSCRQRLAATLEPADLAEEDAAGRRMALRDALSWASEQLEA
jgi:tetratricopeptide (TPR) repeat protein